MSHLLLAMLLFPATPAPEPHDEGYTPDSRVRHRYVYDADRGVPPIWNNYWPHIVSIRPASGDGPRPVLVHNDDATAVKLDVAEGQTPVVETTDETRQFDDGTWALVASDAQVHGETAKLESQPGNLRIGFWSDVDDAVSWEFKATRWGMYQVELTYALAEGASDIVVEVGDQKVEAKVDATGSWYRYVTVPIGKVYLDSAGEKTLTVRCTKKTGGAVMNLKAVLLRPAPEGAAWPIAPQSDGTVLLHSRDALVDGVTLRYEPKPQKNTLGYWANVNDRAHWRFTAPAGTYDIEVAQGCGRGQGGSTVRIDLADQSHEFTVEDTGHFQNFKPRIVGRVTLKGDAPHTLSIVPLNKARGAVMDVRQVRLIPADE